MNKPSMPLLSVIIPIYNGDRYLKKCVDSILTQSFVNFELILVDDGSTDDSPRICDLYSALDSRVKVRHIANGGVSHARNLGIQEAEGDWITFVDCDDWISIDYIKDFSSQKLDPSILYCIQAEMAVNGKIKAWPYRYQEGEYPLKLGSEKQIDKLLIYGTPWGKFFNSSVLRKHNILFDESISNHEDTLFYFEYLSYMNSIYIMASSNYYYIMGNNGSLSRRMASYNEFLHSYEQLDYQLSQIVRRKKLELNKLSHTLHLLYYIRIKAIRSVFKKNMSRDLKKKVLSSVERKNILKHYKIISISSFCMKIVLLLPDLIRFRLLEILKNKL